MTSTFAVLDSFRRIFRSTGSNRRRSAMPRRGSMNLEALESRMLLTNPLTAIPVLNSLPGAAVTIYLDSNGHSETDGSWTSLNSGDTIITPPFNIDGDATTFSNEELRRMEEIWYRVSEDFMPFQVNVSTVEPPTIADFQSIRIVIGGNGSWMPGAGGVALLNSFSQPWSNTAFVFSELFVRPHDIASAVSHEAGHTFGLNHHSEWNPDGSKADEYSRGTPRRAPIMGVGYYSERDVWDNGPGNVTATQIQDDLAVLTRPENQTFRFRADDHGDTRATATRINVTSPFVTATGIIGQNNDVDMFRFDTNTGNISFSVQGLNLRQVYGDPNITYGTNLDAVLRLYDSSGTLIIEDNPAASLFASLSASVSAGTYYVAVSGTGEYGALGQYTLTGTVVPLPTTPTMLAPSGLLTKSVPLFEWTPGSNAESYQLQVDNITTGGTAFYVRTVSTTIHLAEFQFIQADYRARVRTIAADGSFSDWSAFLTFTIDIPAPVQPTLTRPLGEIATSFPTFVWTQPDNAAMYTLWVTNAQTERRVIYRTSYSGTTYQHFDPLPDGNYQAWVRAFNTVGESSPWSDMVEFSIQTAPPTTPAIVSPETLTTNSSPRISWEYDGEAWKFDLWINYRNAGVPQFVREQNIVRQNYFDLQDLPQGTFNAWVRAVNGNGQFGPWSSAYPFTVDILPPDRPTLTGPASPGGSALTTLTPTFSWTAAERAVTYDLWVNNITTGQVQIVRETSLIGLSYTPTFNLSQGEYRAWVRGINSAGEVGVWSSPLSFSIDQPAPARPVFTSPVLNPAGSVTSATPTFTWVSDANALYYEFQVDGLNPFQSRLIQVAGLDTNSFTVPPAQRMRDGSYRAWVRAFNAAGDSSPWSLAFGFRIDVPNPTTPQIIGPGGTIRTRTPKFEWTHNTGAVRYEILVRDLERQEEIVVRVSTFSVSPAGTVASYVLPDNMALRSGTYRFWIRSFNSQGTASAWSASKTFAVSLTMNSVLPQEGDTVDAGRGSATIMTVAGGRTPPNDDAADGWQSVDVPQQQRTVNSVPFADPSGIATGDQAGDSMDTGLLMELMSQMADPERSGWLADPSGDSASGTGAATAVSTERESAAEVSLRSAAAVGFLPLALRRRRRHDD